MKKSQMVWIVGLFLVVINVLFYFFGIGGENVLALVSDLFPIITVVVAGIGLAAAFKSFQEFDATKISWMLLLVGIILFFGGESIYAILELIFKFDMNETFPTIADYSWLAGYIPLFAGLAMLIYGYKKSGFPFGNTKAYTILSTVFIVITGGLIYLLLIPIIKDPETSVFAKFVYLFYPIGDLFLIIPAGFLLYITYLFGRGSVSRPWKYIAAGFIAMTIADILYSYLGWVGLYSAGNASTYIDVAWNAGYLLIGLGGFYQMELIQSCKTRREA
ncbi:MAG: hypothetical protein ACMUIL_09050 [bacterium]